MQGQAAQLMTEGRHGHTVERSQPPQQREGGVHAIAIRRLEPLEGVRLIAGGQHAQQRRGEVDALNLGLSRGAQAIALVPEAAHHARDRGGRHDRRADRRCPA